MALRNIPHQIKTTSAAENRFLLIFSPAGFETFLDTTAVPAPEGVPALTEPPKVANQNVMESAASYGIPVRIVRSVGNGTGVSGVVMKTLV